MQPLLHSTQKRMLSMSLKENKNMLWYPESYKLSEQFFKFWPISTSIFKQIQLITGKEQKEIMKYAMDHLTYNVGTKSEADMICDVFVQKYGFEFEEELIFKPNQTYGYLLWKNKNIETYRKPGNYGNEKNKGVSGIFVRYFDPNYLKEISNGCNNNINISQYFEGWTDIAANIKDYNISDIFKSYQSRAMFDSAKDIKKQMLNHSECNIYMTSYLTNNILGHFAVDIVALDSSLNEVESVIKDYQSSNNVNEFGLFHNINDKKTVRQLYLYPFVENDNYDTLRQEPPEIFFELVERDEITSITAASINKF